MSFRTLTGSPSARPDDPWVTAHCDVRHLPPRDCVIVARNRAEAEAHLATPDGSPFLAEVDFGRETVVVHLRPLCPTFGATLDVTSAWQTSEGEPWLDEDERCCGGGELVSFPAVALALLTTGVTSVEPRVYSGCPIQ